MLLFFDIINLGDNMIKRFLSSIISFVLLILITSLSSFILIRQILFTKQIEELTNNLLEQNNISLKESIFKEQFISYGIPEDVIEYVDETETTEYVMDFFEQYIKSYLGQNDVPSMNNEKLKEIIDNAVLEYEQKNNIKIDTTQFYEGINSYDKALEEQKQNINIDSRITTVFKLIYDQNTIYYLILGIVVCLILLFIINRSIICVLKHISTTLMINGIGLLAMAYVIGKINFNEMIKLKPLINYVSTNINKVAIISIVISILITIGTFIYNKYKEKKVS